MVAKNFEEATSLVKQMLEGGVVNGEVLSGGDAYLDWGEFYTMYKNVASKSLAVQVGRYFQEMGYYVYFSVQGYGSGREGTPICVRIYKTPRNDSSRYVELY